MALNYNTFESISGELRAIGLATCADLVAFYSRERQEGESLADTVKRYCRELFGKCFDCASRLGVDSCENCVYCNCCDEYSALLNI